MGNEREAHRSIPALGEHWPDAGRSLAWTLGAAENLRDDGGAGSIPERRPVISVNRTISTLFEELSSRANTNKKFSSTRLFRLFKASGKKAPSTFAAGYRERWHRTPRGDEPN